MVSGASLVVKPGQVTAALGANGAGKSELCLGIGGALAVSGGSVTVDGTDVTGKTPDAVRAAAIAVVPEGHRILDKLTVDENLRVAGTLLPAAEVTAARTLEADLNLRLFNRTTRSVALTEAGQELLQRISPALDDLGQALAEASSNARRPQGHLRISAPEGSVKILLEDVVPKFLTQYPDIHLEFTTETRMVDIVKDGFDAGIRLLEDVPLDMVAIPFGPALRFAAVASPAYLAAAGTPETPQDLISHKCIRFRFDSGALFKWELEKGASSHALDVSGPLTLGNPHLMIEAALQSIAIAWVPYLSAAPYLSDGRLVRILEEWSPTYTMGALYYPQNRRPPLALRLFAEAVRRGPFAPDD